MKNKNVDKGQTQIKGYSTKYLTSIPWKCQSPKNKEVWEIVTDQNT
jgi:hypothetical protein